MDRGIKYEQDKALNMILSLHTAALSKQLLTTMNLSNSAENQYAILQSTSEKEHIPETCHHSMTNEDYKKKITSMTVKELKAERRRQGIPEKGIYIKNDTQNQLLIYQTDC